MKKYMNEKGKSVENGPSYSTKYTPLSSSSSSSKDDDGCVTCSGGRSGRGLTEQKVTGKSRWGKCERKEEVWDPLIVVGVDIMLKILSGVDAHSLARCLVVSHSWRSVASDDKIWSLKCEELWLGKAHIPRISKARGLSKLAAYSLSVKDGKRIRITKEDLCDHIWEFHFTQEVSDYWLNLDPYWTGRGRPMRRHFHPDGSHTADPDDEVWGGHESCYSVVTSFLGDGSIREHYVRINRWPPMSVSRKPDWSWVLCNKIYVYSSLPDNDKEEGTGPLYPIF